MILLRLVLAPFVNVWRFWTVPIRAEPLALFRILLGLTILASMLTGFVWRLPAVFGDDPIIPGSTRDRWLEDGGRVCLLRGPFGLPVLGHWLPEEIFGKNVPNWAQDSVGPKEAEAWRVWGERPASGYLLFGLCLLSLLMMTLGLLTRLSTLAAVLLVGTFHNYLSEYINGGDYLMLNGLWFLLLSPAGATWSVDAWLWRKWSGKEDEGPVMVPPWSVRLMQIQVCILYLFVGLTKLRDLRFDPFEPVWYWPFAWWPRGDWIDGNALYWVMNDIAITRWSYAQLPIPYFICQLMTWGTLIFEIAFPLLVLWKWTRIPLLIFGVLLHVGILVVMEIGWFSQVTLCWYVLFLSGDTVTAAVRWCLGLPARPEAALSPSPP